MHSLRRRYKAVVECRQRQDGEAAGIVEKAKVSPKESGFLVVSVRVRVKCMNLEAYKSDGPKVLRCYWACPLGQGPCY